MAEEAQGKIELTRRQAVTAMGAGAVTLAATHSVVAYQAAQWAEQAPRQQADDYAAEIERLKGLLALYEGLEQIGIDAIVAGALTGYKGVLDALRTAVGGLRDAVQGAEGAIANFHDAFASLRAGLKTAEEGVSNVVALLQNAQNWLGQTTSPLEPLLDQVHQFFDDLLGKIPFGVGDNIRKTVDGLIGLVVAIPAMIARGYERKFSIGCLASAGTLAILIPPSIPMIVYSSQTGASVAALFAAGIIPGIIVTAMLSLFVLFRVWKDPQYRSARGMTRQEKIRAFKEGLPLMIIPVGLLGAIYSGSATPTEAAAAFALYTLVLGVVLREIRLSNLWLTLRNSALVSAMLLIILLSAGVLNIIVARTHAIEVLTRFALSQSVPPWGVIVLSMILLIFGGMIFESAAMMMIIQPILAPIAAALGYDIVWLGILIVINAEIAQISPPVGIVLYALHAALGSRLGVKMEEIMWGALPFMIPLMAGLLMVGLFPKLSLWLPKLLLQ